MVPGSYDSDEMEAILPSARDGERSRIVLQVHAGRGENAVLAPSRPIVVQLLSGLHYADRANSEAWRSEKVVSYG